MMHRLTFRALALAALLALAGTAVAAPTEFLVVALDRGFRGNETVKKRFAEYHEQYPDSRLFFMTRRLSASRLASVLAEIQSKAPERLVVLPLVVSRHEPAFRAFLEDLDSLRASLDPPLEVEVLPAFGGSPAARSILEDHARGTGLETPAGPVVVVGSGAADEKSRSGIRATLQDLSRVLPVETQVEVLFSGRNEAARRENDLLYERIRSRASEVDQLTVVPYFLDFRADHHMAVDSALARELKSPRIRLQTLLPDQHPAVSSWLSRSTAGSLPPTPSTLGVVLLAHGADLLWNEEIAAALAPVGRSYDVELSFNMADPWLIQEAVSALEARGKRHIVIYRLFGLERSFRTEVESMIGLAAHRGHGSHGTALLRSSAHLATIGGIEDHPLFAEALLERALAVSGGDRGNEVVLLVAHGAGEEQDDRHWNELLASLGRQMEARATPRFHAVEGVTLREDWPEQHRQALAAIEAKVRAHRAAGRRVLAVEARINGPGPTRKLLEPLGVTVEDEGFAPHLNLSRLVLEDLDEFLEKAGEAPTSARR
ncbi:MAG: sirohydrochlorin chelatase [Vicinamibacteria bacterium]